MTWFRELIDVRLDLCAHICVFMCIDTCVCIFMFMYVCVCICVHTQVHAWCIYARGVRHVYIRATTQWHLCLNIGSFETLTFWMFIIVIGRICSEALLASLVGMKKFILFSVQSISNCVPVFPKRMQNKPIPEAWSLKPEAWTWQRSLLGCSHTFR